MTDTLKKFQSKLHCVAHLQMNSYLFLVCVCVCRIADSLSSLQILPVVFIAECDIIWCVISLGNLSQLSQQFFLST